MSTDFPCVFYESNGHLICEVHETTDCPTIQEIKETTK